MDEDGDVASGNAKESHQGALQGREVIYGDFAERGKWRQQWGFNRTMKFLAQNLAVCGLIAILSSIGISLLLILGARLPRIGPVPFATACERANTLGLRIWVFMIVFTLGVMCLSLRELRRRAFEKGLKRRKRAQNDLTDRKDEGEL